MWTIGIVMSHEAIGAEALIRIAVKDCLLSQATGLLACNEVLRDATRLLFGGTRGHEWLASPMVNGEAI